MATLNNRFFMRPFSLVGRLLLLLTLCFVSRACVAQQFQVDGNLSFNSWDASGKPVQEISHEFSLCVSNCCWQMIMTPEEKGGIDYHVITYDGTQLYVFDDMETMVKNNKTNGVPISEANNLGFGMVLNSEVPHAIDIDGAGQIWLSYASACNFRNLAVKKNGDSLCIGCAKTTRNGR